MLGKMMMMSLYISLLKKYKILHLGPEDNGTTSQRLNALNELGHNVKSIFYIRKTDQPSYTLNQKITYKKIKRFMFRKIGYPIEHNNENQVLLNESISFSPDLIFIEKGLTIKKKTLLKIKKYINKTIIISFSLDDMLNPDHQSKYYLSSLALYDIHFTNKTYNVPELYDLGAKKVYYLSNAFCSKEHVKIELSNDEFLKYKSDITFVGGYEKARAEDIYYIAQNGFSVRVWGNNWHKCKYKHQNIQYEYRAAYGIEYSKIISASKITLGFLRKINRDEETTRTVELTAMGGFMLAERSDAQKKLFFEKIDAEYFSDKEELLEKIKYYLKNSNSRLEIALNGYHKCLDLKLSQIDKMDELLRYCFSN